MLLAPHSILVREYANLGHPYSVSVPATPLPSAARQMVFNQALADQMGLIADPNLTETLAVLTGQQPWPDYPALASVYCGHQFGVFVPQLGDGRALMVAELRKGAQYWQLQLKGAGPTPYSRRADGRAVLRSSLREYVASEAMHALGIPTTRALSLTTTPDPVFRETTEPAAVVCRVAESFLRFGHVEFFSSTGQLDSLKSLLIWHIERSNPECLIGDPEDDLAPTLLAWFGKINQATAKLVAQWQSVGFCHGVMNTDNMSLLGLTLDYGPYGFLDEFNVDHICNHSDHGGRYSYRNQPQIAHWNLYALAQALLPLCSGHKDDLQNLLDEFPAHFQHAHLHLFATKLGLNPQAETTEPMIESTLQMLHEHRVDMTRFFRSLGHLVGKMQTERHNSWDINTLWHHWQSASTFTIPLGEPEAIEAAKIWLGKWVNILTPETTVAQLNAVNPIYIARNHLLQEAIQASERGDDSVLHRLLSAVCSPFHERHELRQFAEPAPDWAKSLEISCSS